jgi:riboflavin kinase/FMN adenylyltransferase
MKTDILNFAQYNGGVVVALGKFDGIHIGHSELLSYTSKKARELGCAAAMYIISPGKCNLSDEQDMLRTAKELGIDVIYTDLLTEEYKAMSPEQFVEKIIFRRLGAKHVVVGYNYRFGKDRCGNTDLLCSECAKYDIDVTVIDCVTACIDADTVAVSSTEVRQRLAKGDVSAAAIMLGRPYCIKGVVEHGRRLGHMIGFPTINFYPTGCLLPIKGGVYATRVTVDGVTYKGLTNIGYNPTVTNNNALRVETHILDFNKDIYGKPVRLEFIEHIRGEKKFDSLEELSRQIDKDKEIAKKFEI